MARLMRWEARSERWRDAAVEWFAHRKRDLAWRRARLQFLDELPRLLAAHEWVFIVGCNNSGTTLVHDVLAATGHFSTMPHEGQRYTEVLRRAQKRGHERVWTEYLDELRLDETDSTATAPRLLFDWLSVLEQPAKARILEKTTANAVRMRWLQSVLPHSAFIGVVRSGYAVAEGIKRKGGKDVTRAVRHWNRVNEVMLEDAEQIRRFMLVRYEDFVAAPDEFLPKLMTFLGLTAAAREPRPTDAAGAAGGAIRNMNDVSVGRLTDQEMSAIALHGGDLLQRLGYARPAGGVQ